jgi:hypothetical protein
MARSTVTFSPAVADLPGNLELSGVFLFLARYR